MASQPSSTGVPPPPTLDIHNAPVVVGWAGSETESIGASLSSTPATIDIDFDPSCEAFSLRIRFALFVRGSTKAMPVYLLVNAQQIKSVNASALKIAESDDPISDDRSQHLVFCLERPPLFITPIEALQPKDKAQTALLRSIRSAARAHEISITIRPDVLSQFQTTTLCSATYQDFIPSNRLADLSSLYGGRGGKVVENAAFPGASAEDPPSYGDSGAPPALASASQEPAETPSKKRCLDSPNDQSLDVSLIEAICKKIWTQHYNKSRTELSMCEARIVDRLEKRLDDQVSALTDDCQAKLRTLEDRVQSLEQEMGRLDDACNSGITRLEEQIEKVNEDIGWRVDSEIEEQITSAKIELEDFVKDELKNSEDSLKEKLAEASVSIVFDD